MKKLLTTIVFTLLFASAFAQTDFSFKKDKQKHFGYSIPIGYVTYFAASDLLHLLKIDIIDNNRFLRIGGGTLLVILVNTGKEFTDIGGSGFNIADIAWGGAGGLVGSSLSDLLSYKTWKNNKLRQIEQMEKERVASLTDEEKLLEEIAKRK